MNEALPNGFQMTELGPLPEEWRVVRLGELVEKRLLLIRGGFPQGQHNEVGNGVPHLRPFNITNDGNLDLSQIKYIAPPSEDDPHWLRPNDVIFNNTNSEELVGKTALFDRNGQFVLSNHMTLLRILEPNQVDAYWLSRQLHYFWYLGLYKSLCRRHVNQASISLERLKGIPIPLPPLPEQRAIAHVLRTVQRAKEATEGVIAALRELKKSLMQHLFTYGPVPVTERERVPLQETEIGPLPAHWRVVRLGEVVDVKGGKRLPKGDEFASNPTPYPYIRIVDFKNGSVDIRNLKFLTEEQHILLNRYIITSNDVYISIAGTIGLVGSVPEELNGAHLTENAARLILNTNRLYRQFLVVALQSDMVQGQIQARATKTSQPKLALARIKEIPIPLPPLDEQREIARMLQAVDAKIAAEQARCAALEELFKSLLHELMSGRIRVPNNVGGQRSRDSAPDADPLPESED
jgi:type I restriction enzyme S subunit